MAQAVKKRSSQRKKLAPRAPMYVPPRREEINVNVSCKASLEEIAALGPVRCMAFMNGVAQVLSALNPPRP